MGLITHGRFLQVEQGACGAEIDDHAGNVDKGGDGWCSDNSGIKFDCSCSKWENGASERGGRDLSC